MPTLSLTSVFTVIEKDLVMTDNKRPIKYSLTEAGYTLAEGLCPIAGVAIHAPTFRSDSYLGEARRNSYGAGGSNGKRAATPPLFADEEGGDDDFERQMAQAMQLSRLESSGGRPTYVAPRTEASAHQRAAPLPLPLPLPLERPRHPSSGGSSSTNRTSGPVMDGRKAASGHYAARAAPAAGGPVAGNVGELGRRACRDARPC